MTMMFLAQKGREVAKRVQDIISYALISYIAAPEWSVKSFFSGIVRALDMVNFPVGRIRLLDSRFIRPMSMHCR